MKRLFYITLFGCCAVLVALAGLERVNAGQEPPEEEHHLYLSLLQKPWPSAPYDMVDFLSGDGRIYEVQHSNGSQARHQTRIEGTTFFHTKGNEIKAEWEELWYTPQFIMRGTDTSPGNGQYYTLRDQGMYGSAWAPRYWNEGELFYRNPYVSFYQKSDCTTVMTGRQASWLKFEAYHQHYTFESGITLDNVVQLAWLLDRGGEPVEPPIERYYYAELYGLVGWWSNDRGMSYISEIHDPGERPDNKMEEISCLNRSPLPQESLFWEPLPYWPGNHRR
jgi:hypothetical protein